MSVVVSMIAATEDWRHRHRYYSPITAAAAAAAEGGVSLCARPFHFTRWMERRGEKGNHKQAAKCDAHKSICLFGFCSAVLVLVGILHVRHRLPE